MNCSQVSVPKGMLNMRITVETERNVKILALTLILLGATTLYQGYKLSKLSVEVEMIKANQVKVSTSQYPVDESLIRAIIAVESNGDANAYNKSSGATGKMQLRKIIYADFCNLTQKEAFDANKNVQCGAKFLAYLIKLYKNDTNKAILHYNSGYKKSNKKYLQKVTYLVQNEK